MTLLGAHVGKHTVRAKSLTVCWRCGFVFDHHLENVQRGAPCRSCRDYLVAEVEEGDPKPNWRRQRNGQQ